MALWSAPRRASALAAAAAEVEARAVALPLQRGRAASKRPGPAVAACARATAADSGAAGDVDGVHSGVRGGIGRRHDDGRLRGPSLRQRSGVVRRLARLLDDCANRRLRRHQYTRMGPRRFQRRVDEVFGAIAWPVS